MAWAIITIYTSKCAQMEPQQLPETSKFYSKCKKSDIEKTLARRLSLSGIDEIMIVSIKSNFFSHKGRCGMKICPAWSAVRKISNINMDGSDKCCNWFS